MSVTVQSVIDRVQATLQDTTGVRWPVTQLELWVNDAQREICLLKPDASATNDIVTLVAGTKQSIPSAGNRLLRVVRNYSHDAYIQPNDNNGNPVTTSGKRAIRIVDREVLDSQTPDWHDASLAAGDAAHGATVKHYAYDESDPRNFYVYPGVSGNAYIEIVYSANPVPVAASSTSADGDWNTGTTYGLSAVVNYLGVRYKSLQGGNSAKIPSDAANSAWWVKVIDLNLSIPDIFANAVMNYVTYMAYMKDAEFAGNRERANNHYQLFITSISSKGQIDVVTSPTFTESRPIQPPPMS